MTKIEAIIRPSKLDDVKNALTGPWLTGLTVSEVKGYGRQKGHTEFFRGAEYKIEFSPKVKIELVVPDPLVPRTVEELMRQVRTLKIGDGKIFLTRIDEAVRVRTGERGEDAL